MNRRAFIASSLGGLGVSLLPKNIFASTTSEKKFIFIFNQGGWDPTRVFVPAFSNPLVAMEAMAGESQMGNIKWVSHPNRPSVDSFFQHHYQNSLVINGLQVRSIAHEICTCLAYTGTISGSNPDWATTIAAHSLQNLSIPHLVLGGPNFAGVYGAYVVETGGNNQLAELLDGSIQEKNDLYQAQLSSPTRSLIDQHIQARVHAEKQKALYGKHKELATAYQISIDNALLLQNQRYMLHFSSSTSLEAQIDSALDALSKGVARCASLNFIGNSSMGWDSHANNDDTQSQLFEALFSDLDRLIFQLQATTDEQGIPLSQTTTVVVFSEMGRTPGLNGTNGKDHWPFTSLLLWGNDITGNRVMGDFTADYQGQKLDFTTGENTAFGKTLGIESIGAGLLALADIDPTEYIMDAEPLLGMLR